MSRDRRMGDEEIKDDDAVTLVALWRRPCVTGPIRLFEVRECTH